MKKPIEAVLDKKIENVAHKMAQGRGLASGHELDDWLQAKQEVFDAVQAQGADVLIKDNEPSIAAQLSDALQQRIAQKAFHRAQQRNFEPGYALADWIEAEQEVEMEIEAMTGSSRAYPSVYNRIADLAYRRAEERGFTPGFEQEDWYTAERAVEAQLEMAEIGSSMFESRSQQQSQF